MWPFSRVVGFSAHMAPSVNMADPARGPTKVGRGQTHSYSLCLLPLAKNCPALARRFLSATVRMTFTLAAGNRPVHYIIAPVRCRVRSSSTPDAQTKGTHNFQLHPRVELYPLWPSHRGHA